MSRTSLLWALGGGTQIGCVPEREYSQSDRDSDSGTPATDDSSDAGDASVTAEDPDAQNSSVTESTDVGELSVTLGQQDASGSSDASVSDNADSASTQTSEASGADAGGSAVADAASEGTSNGTTTASPSTSGTLTLDESDAGTTSISVTDAGTSDAGTDAGPDASPSCVPSSEVEADCANNDDEDCDGLLGCEDVEDCGEAVVCQPGCMASGDTELTCDDEEDEDCDGFKDCEDTDCALDSNCLVACVPTTEDCSDGEDNDCDGFEDCADSACAATAGCCVGDDAEVCDDGVDNNCDGVLDCPVILSTVPARPASNRTDWEGGAVSADKATLSLDTPAQQDYVVQCRSGKPAAVSSQQFVVCDAANPSSLAAKPFALVEGPNAEHDGLMTTQVRFAYPNGQVSQPVSFTYYIHSSIYGAEECVPKAADADYFVAAENYLLTEDSVTFADADARLAAPFVNIAFTPALSARFEVAEDDGVVEYLSLRRRFVLNASKNLILMKRTYKSRTNTVDDCRATTIRKHLNDLGDDIDWTRYFRNRCDAIVMNREGAGVCLVVNESNTITIANPTSSAWQTANLGWVNWLQADNFMWRKLRVGGISSGRVFSRKCYEGGSACNGGDSNVLYLPDHELFAP